MRPRELEPMHRTRGAAGYCEWADGHPACVHLARFSLASAGVAGALEKGGYRVRDFGGHLGFPVMERVRTWTLHSMTCKSAFMLHAL